MIIDFHTHSFPDALAPRAMESLKKNSEANPLIKPHTDGTAKDAERILRAAGIDRAAVCNIATNPRQESKVNDYAISLLSNPFFYPLGSVHPDSENTESELDRLFEKGIKGIKLHPDYVGIELSDERFDRIFSSISRRGMFVVVHAGYDPVSPEKQHATPDMFRAVIDKYPTLRLIAAHTGGYGRAEDVYKYLVGTNIYLDTSLSSLREGEREILYKILRDHDEDRLLFGTDTPWTEPREEVDFIMNAPIDEKRREKIFSGNAMRLLET